MPVNYSPAIDILPELLIAGILAFLFYTNFRKLKAIPYIQPRFILVRGDNYEEGGDQSWINKSTSINDAGENLSEALRGSQMILFTVTLWVVLTMLMLPVSKLYLIFPRFGSLMSPLIYGLLTGIIGVTIIATVVTRIKNTRMNLVLLLAIGGVGAFMAFYLPLMGWASEYGQIMKLVFIYCAVAMTVFGIYYINSVMKVDNAMKVATIGSYVSYFSTSALLALNLFYNLF